MGAAPTIHGVRPPLTWLSCTWQSTVLENPSPWSMSQTTWPSSVHGVCQVVLVMTSGQRIRRPAPHMPVNSLQRSQKPSRAAIGSRIRKPHAGQASTLVIRAGTWRVRRRKPSRPRPDPFALALPALRPGSPWPDGMAGAPSTLMDIEVLPLVPSDRAPPGQACRAPAAAPYQREVTRTWRLHPVSTLRQLVTNDLSVARPCVRVQRCREARAPVRVLGTMSGERAHVLRTRCAAAAIVPARRSHGRPHLAMTW
jgi:hypothetical protein